MRPSNNVSGADGAPCIDTSVTNLGYAPSQFAGCIDPAGAAINWRVYTEVEAQLNPLRAELETTRFELEAAQLDLEEAHAELEEARAGAEAIATEKVLAQLDECEALVELSAIRPVAAEDHDDLRAAVARAREGVARRAAARAALAAAERAGLEAEVEAFVAEHSGRRQRGSEWYDLMGVTVGGSELAALMGMSPYSKRADIIESKVASLGGGSTWRGGGPACWWGVLFEDVIAAYVAVDLGGAVRGDEICVCALPGHRNSPDGFIVAGFCSGGPGEPPRLWTTDMPPEARDLPLEPLLLEFKCPVSRRPTGGVPRQYKPQLWSGLAVSPVARRGLFVDAVFRKCGLLDLGDTPAYDAAYHRAAPSPDWGLPLAWGLIGVYAPGLDAPPGVRRGWRGAEWAPGDPSSDEPDADGALAGWQVHAAYFGARPRPADLAASAVDFGDMEPRLFDRALGLINRGRFRVARGPPCFADGRGGALPDVAAAVDAFRRAAPADHWLVGVLPWKLLEVSYAFVDRRPGFAEEIAPLIADVHRTVAAAVASGDPAAFLAAQNAAAAAGAPPAPPSLCESDVQDLFDLVAGAAS